MATPSPSPSPPAAGPGPTCPACQAAVPAGSRFCPSCGAAVGAPPPPPPSASAGSGAAPPAPGAAPGGAPPVDIRSRVEQDRGFLKRLQLLIPGFRGYRLGEDAREADSLLRLQIADRVHQSVVTINQARGNLAQAGQFQAINDLAQALSELQMLEGRIRHAEQGYTGIAPAIRVNPQTVDRLYEYDYGFAEAAAEVGRTTQALVDAVGGGSSTVPGQVTTLRTQIRQLDTAFRARMAAVEGVQV